jgi:hypothetical protein
VETSNLTLHTSFSGRPSCVCVCVCECTRARAFSLSLSHIHIVCVYIHYIWVSVSFERTGSTFFLFCIQWKLQSLLAISFNAVFQTGHVETDRFTQSARRPKTVPSRMCRREKKDNAVVCIVRSQSFISVWPGIATDACACVWHKKRGVFFVSCKDYIASVVDEWNVSMTYCCKTEVFGKKAIFYIINFTGTGLGSSQWLRFTDRRLTRHGKVLWYIKGIPFWVWMITEERCGKVPPYIKKNVGKRAPLNMKTC